MLRYISPYTTPEDDRERLLKLLQSEADMFAQAAAMQALCKRHGYTQSSLAKELQVSQSSVGNKIRLLAYSQAERQAILHYSLTERHARALLVIQPPKRAKLIETAGNMHLNVRQTEELAEKYRNDEEFACAEQCLQLDLSEFSVERFIAQTGSAVDRLRACGSKIAYIIEQGEGWKRLTITIREHGST